jgi:hypothetical protein
MHRREQRLSFNGLGVPPQGVKQCRRENRMILVPESATFSSPPEANAARERFLTMRFSQTSRHSCPTM